MPNTSEQLEQAIGDLDYLIDEISALRVLIESVPVYERPGGEMSICEYLQLLDFAQVHVSNDERADIADWLNQNDAVISTFLKQRIAADEVQRTGVQHYLDMLLKNRTSLVAKLRTPANASQTSYLPTATAESLVRFDRRILRIIAERILSVKREDAHV